MNSVFHDPAYQEFKRQLIAATGFAFYADRDDLLGEAIDGRLAALGLGDRSSYVRLLADGGPGSAEMEFLIARLTIGETYFFRDGEQLAAIRDVVLPDILQRNQSVKELRIWSAGCAGGAEPYSLAMVLMDQMADQIADWRVCIYASDLNRNYLTQAAAGKFRPTALRALSEEMKRKCFSNEGRIWTIHPRYRRWISFHQLNLVASPFATPLGRDAHFDLILCRNVMIYFSPEASRRLIGQFHECLEEGGWLVVGSCEYSVENYTAFRTVSAPGARLYQKQPAAAAPAEVATAQPSRSLLIAPPRSPLSALQPSRLGTPQGSARGAQQRRPMGAPPPPTRESVQPPDKPGPAGMEVLRQLADLGDWQNAAEYGQKLLTEDRLNPSTHFYQALILENLGILDQSQRSLRHAIYLDRHFALAHYHLGLALKRDRRGQDATRAFGNVLRVLYRVPGDAMVTAGGGVTAAALKALAKMQLENSRGQETQP